MNPNGNLTKLHQRESCLLTTIRQGIPSPAMQIFRLQQLKEAGKLLDINLLDHLILMPEGYCSMADEGLI